MYTSAVRPKSQEMSQSPRDTMNECDISSLIGLVSFPTITHESIKRGDKIIQSRDLHGDLCSHYFIGMNWAFQVDHDGVYKIPKNKELVQAMSDFWDKKFADLGRSMPRVKEYWQQNIAVINEFLNWFTGRNFGVVDVVFWSPVKLGGRNARALTPKEEQDIRNQPAMTQQTWTECYFEPYHRSLHWELLKDKLRSPFRRSLKRLEDRECTKGASGEELLLFTMQQADLHDDDWAGYLAEGLLKSSHREQLIQLHNGESYSPFRGIHCLGEVKLPFADEATDGTALTYTGREKDSFRKLANSIRALKGYSKNQLKDAIVASWGRQANPAVGDTVVVPIMNEKKHNSMFDILRAQGDTYLNMGRKIKALACEDQQGQDLLSSGTLSEWEGKKTLSVPVPGHGHSHLVFVVDDQYTPLGLLGLLRRFQELRPVDIAQQLIQANPHYEFAHLQLDDVISVRDPLNEALPPESEYHPDLQLLRLQESLDACILDKSRADEMDNEN